MNNVDIKTVIDGAIKEIQEQQINRRVELQEDLRIIEDLGFSSLDLAQLIARLEIELNFDPFSNGVPLSSIRRISDLYKVYQAGAKI